MGCESGPGGARGVREGSGRAGGGHRCTPRRLWDHGHSKSAVSPGRASERRGEQGTWPCEARIGAFAGACPAALSGSPSRHRNCARGLMQGLGSSMEPLVGFSPRRQNRGGGAWRGYYLELPRGAASTAVTYPVFPLSPPDGLAVEGDSGCVPGPAGEEGLPHAGGGPGVPRAPHLPLRGIHLPRRRSALPGHLRGRVVPGQAPWQVSDRSSGPSEAGVVVGV